MQRKNHCDKRYGSYYEGEFMIVYLLCIQLYLLTGVKNLNTVRDEGQGRRDHGIVNLLFDSLLHDQLVLRVGNDPFVESTKSL